MSCLNIKKVALPRARAVQQTHICVAFEQYWTNIDKDHSLTVDKEEWAGWFESIETG